MSQDDSLRECYIGDSLSVIESRGAKSTTAICKQSKMSIQNVILTVGVAGMCWHSFHKSKKQNLPFQNLGVSCLHGFY